MLTGWVLSTDKPISNKAYHMLVSGLDHTGWRETDHQKYNYKKGELLLNKEKMAQIFECNEQGCSVRKFVTIPKESISNLPRKQGNKVVQVTFSGNHCHGRDCLVPEELLEQVAKGVAEQVDEQEAKQGKEEEVPEPEMESVVPGSPARLMLSVLPLTNSLRGRGWRRLEDLSVELRWLSGSELGLGLLLSVSALLVSITCES